MIVCLIAQGYSGVTFAHPEINDSIALVSERIDADPSNGKLYLRRGELYRGIGSWVEAADDYDRANELAPDLIEVERAQAELALELGNPGRAVELAKRYLDRQAKHPRGLLILARGLRELEHAEAANQTYLDFMEVAAHPQPDHYLEWASVMENAGRWAAAGEILRQGISKLGPLTALLQRAVLVDRKAGDYQSALAKIDLLIETTPRRELWLVRKGQIFEELGRLEEARLAYEQARDSLASRSAARRALPALIELEEKVESGLDRLSQLSDPKKVQ